MQGQGEECNAMNRDSDFPVRKPHATSTLGVAVTSEPGASIHTNDAARAFAVRANLPWVDVREAASEMALVFADSSVSLHARAAPDESAKHGWLRPLVADFAALDISSPQGRRKNQPLARALGRREGSSPLRVLDATAGLGQDSFLIAALGHEVFAVERSPVVAALLREGLAQAAATSPEIVARISLLETDARELTQKSVTPLWDVVYLDPMFPPRGKSAREKKAMRILRRIVGEDLDAAELFAMACTMATKRVVVKRPTHAPPLAPHPVTAHAAKGIRYDVYSVVALRDATLF